MAAVRRSFVGISLTSVLVLHSMSRTSSGAESGLPAAYDCHRWSGSVSVSGLDLAMVAVFQVSVSGSVRFSSSQVESCRFRLGLS